MRYIIPASKLRTYGSSVQVYFGHYSENYTIGEAWIGHKGSSVQGWDFDGNQVQLKFSAADGVTVTTPGVWSDDTAFDLDAQKDLVIAIYFTTDDIPRGPLEPDVITYFKDGNDASTEDADGYSILPDYNAQRVVDIVCTSAGVSTTTTTTSTATTTTFSGTSSTVSTTTSSLTTTPPHCTTTTTTTTGPYWSWYQDKPVLLVDPNWIAPVDQRIEDPTDTTRFYGKEYFFGHYREVETILEAEFLRDGLQEIRSMFDFFDLVKGRQRSFWFPSWVSDINVTASIDSADLVLTVEDFKWAEFYKYKGTAQYLFFAFPDGTTAVKKLISATSSSITINEAIGTSVSADQLNRLLVSFLHYGRFDQDELEMEYLNALVSKCRLIFHGIPVETPGVLSSTTTTTTTTQSSTSTTSSSTTSTTA